MHKTQKKGIASIYYPCSNRFSLLLFTTILLIINQTNALSSSPLKQFRRSLSIQYRRRLDADPRFLSKSITEIVLASGTQFAAEVSRRGSSRILPEIDFVFAGMLTAIAGKFYSMWRVAPTLTEDAEGEKTVVYRGVPVPTNAFRLCLSSDVEATVTRRHKLMLRILALLTPAPALFRAGILASAFGYGITSILIFLRGAFLPSYTPQTQNVNVVYASIYTGFFLAIVSNIRYQVLQGVIEPFVDSFFSKFPQVQNALIFLMRLCNGLLGSVLALEGMRLVGLQRLK